MLIQFITGNWSFHIFYIFLGYFTFLAVCAFLLDCPSCHINVCSILQLLPFCDIFQNFLFIFYCIYLGPLFFLINLAKSSSIFFIFKKFCFILYLLYIFIVCTGSSLLHGLFSSLGRWGSPIIGHTGFSLLWPLLGPSMALGHVGVSSCNPSAVAVPRLQTAGSVAAPWHEGSSRARDGTHVSCISRRTLYH